MFYTLGKASTRLRELTPWLQAMPFAPVRHPLKYQADTRQAYFKGKRERPRFKGRRGDNSVTISNKVRIHARCTHIPKLGWHVCAAQTSRQSLSSWVANQATIKHIRGKWYCTVSYEPHLPEKTDKGLAEGIDRNVGQTVLSAGDIIPFPDTSRLEVRRKRHQLPKALASPNQPDAGQCRFRDRDRGPEREGHEGKRDKNNGTAKHERQAESGPEPGDSQVELAQLEQTLGCKALERSDFRRVGWRY